MDISAHPEITTSTPALRVFVVDDVPSARAGLCAFLSMSPDFEVVGQAADGAEALEQISLTLPDAVIMDIEMPRMDGLEATRHLREQELPVRIVVLSIAFDRRADALAAGADAFVQKGEPLWRLIALLEGFRSARPPVPGSGEISE